MHVYWPRVPPPPPLLLGFEWRPALANVSNWLLACTSVWVQLIVHVTTIIAIMRSRGAYLVGAGGWLAGERGQNVWTN